MVMLMSLYVRDLKKILEGLDDDTVVEIDTVDGIKPVHEVQFQDIEYFCGINSNYEPIESTYPALVLVLGHQVFQEGTISDRELFDFCYEERDPLINEISFWIKKGLTDDGKRKISRKTADKWNDILWDMRWHLPVTNHKKVGNYSVDSNGCLHFHGKQPKTNGD